MIYKENTQEFAKFKIIYIYIYIYILFCETFSNALFIILTIFPSQRRQI